MVPIKSHYYRTDRKSNCDKRSRNYRNQTSGFLEIDARLIPRQNDYRYSISGLSHGYEAGKRGSGAFSRVMSSIFNPADALYNIFGKKPRELAKLREMKKDQTVKEVLASKFDRETLSRSEE